MYSLSRRIQENSNNNIMIEYSVDSNGIINDYTITKTSLITGGQTSSSYWQRSQTVEEFEQEMTLEFGDANELTFINLNECL